MNLEIAIPTKGRLKKLERTVNSIFISAKNIPISLSIYFSLQSELDEFQKIIGNLSNVKLEVVYNYRVPEFWNSCLKKTEADALCYLNDDVLLLEDTIETIIKEFKKTFYNYDGVMGLRQVNIPEKQAVEGAFGIIGKKYTERFPEGQVWCPDYNRFYADFELWQFARQINKFYFCTTARIEHLHPCTNHMYRDKTHDDVRQYLEADKQTFHRRQAQGLLWGNKFNLLNQ